MFGAVSIGVGPGLRGFFGSSHTQFGSLHSDLVSRRGLCLVDAVLEGAEETLLGLSRLLCCFTTAGLCFLTGLVLPAASGLAGFTDSVAPACALCAVSALLMVAVVWVEYPESLKVSVGTGSLGFSLLLPKSDGCEVRLTATLACAPASAAFSSSEQ